MLALYDVRYRGPQQVEVIELAQRELDPARLCGHGGVKIENGELSMQNGLDIVARNESALACQTEKVLKCY